MQAKIFQAVVKPALESMFVAFSEAVGHKVGGMLVEYKADVEQKLRHLKFSSVEVTASELSANNPSELNRSDATAAMLPAEERSGNPRTIRRNRQRKRRPNSIAYDKNTLLLVKDADIGNTNAKDHDLSLHQRVANLEVIVTCCNLKQYERQDVEWAPFQSSVVEAGSYDHACRDNDLVDSSIVDVSYDSFNFRLREQDILDAPARHSFCADAPLFAPKFADEKSEADPCPGYDNSLNVEVAPFELVLKEESIWKPVFVNHCDSCQAPLLSACASSLPHLCGLCNVAVNLHQLPIRPSRDTTPACGGQDAAGVAVQHAVEEQIAFAIHETVNFKLLSGEPWRAFSDENSFHMAARHFFAVSRDLPDWPLDDLGRALNYCNLEQSGRSLAEPQLDICRRFRAALVNAEVVIDTTTFVQATYFYAEVGHFRDL